jgi:hypothetical protein
MNEAYISIIVAIVGLLSGVMGATIAARYQLKLEQEKWRAMRQDSFEKEKRVAVADLCKKMVEVVQEIGWITWSANYQPHRITLQHSIEYDLKIKQLLPEVMSLLVVVSSLDSGVHKSMDILVKKVYELDDNVSKALIVFEKSPEKGIEILKSCHPGVKSFWETVNIAVADQFNDKTS